MNLRSPAIRPGPPPGPRRPRPPPLPRVPPAPADPKTAPSATPPSLPAPPGSEIPRAPKPSGVARTPPAPGVPWVGTVAAGRPGIERDRAGRAGPRLPHDHHADRAVRALVQRPPGRPGRGPGRGPGGPAGRGHQRELAVAGADGVVQLLRLAQHQPAQQLAGQRPW